MARRHFLRIPGANPIEFNVEADDQRSPCHGCGATSRQDVDLWHHAECPAARAMVARDAADITEDGAQAFVGALRAQLAEEYADNVIAAIGRRSRSGDEAGETEAPTIAVLSMIRESIVGGYLAGYARAEQAALRIVRTGLARLSSEINAWSGSSDDG